MGSRPEQTDPRGDDRRGRDNRHFVECQFIHYPTCPTWTTSTEQAAPSGLQPIRRQLLLSASCLLVFSMLHLLHLYLLHSSFLWIRFGTGERHGHAPVASPSLSLEATLMFLWTMYLTPSQHRTRIQYTVHNALYVREEWAWRPEDSFVSVSWTWVTALSYFTLECGASFVTYMPMKRARNSVLVKTGNIVLIRTRWRTGQILPAEWAEWTLSCYTWSKAGSSRVSTARGRRPGPRARNYSIILVKVATSSWPLL